MLRRKTCGMRMTVKPPALKPVLRQHIFSIQETISGVFAIFGTTSKQSNIGSPGIHNPEMVQNRQKPQSRPQTTYRHGLSLHSVKMARLGPFRERSSIHLKTPNR
ncbi:hypothetical protein [Thalassospira povalilytica]|uniref:hypothetical protein n=1 Tax=Thalassospira povalilytica TaxID=732237 RepID=UPI001D18FF34|nr:hypothetical protein [Thalassospira povalilytica]MCC4241572.1 hypothetical protein [Thalassospira povalilytica]